MADCCATFGETFELVHSTHVDSGVAYLRHALIGHTGFVGGALKASHAFTNFYNSKNFREMGGEYFELLICAGVSAVKWVANKNPDQDWAAIAELIEVLDRVNAAEVILISTIDVYPDPSKELDESAVIDPTANHAYGRHRFQLEEWVRQRFPVSRIVRLPALFGPGLKKNALYDLIHENNIGQINPSWIFQWYPLTRLWSDLETIRAHELELVNLFTEPLPMHRIIDAFFPSTTVGASTQPAASYRLKTLYFNQFGGADGYVMSADDCLKAIGAFVQQTRNVTV